MVPLDRALVSSYRLSIVTMSLTAAVWPQFATQVFGCGAVSDSWALVLQRYPKSFESILVKDFV